MELSAISAMVLDAVADDYEEIEQITMDVIRMAAERDLPVDPTVVVGALQALVGGGLVRGFVLSPIASPVAVEKVDWGDVAGLYFYATQRGLAVIQGERGEGTG